VLLCDEYNLGSILGIGVAQSVQFICYGLDNRESVTGRRGAGSPFLLST